MSIKMVVVLQLSNSTTAAVEMAVLDAIVPTDHPPDIALDKNLTNLFLISVTSIVGPMDDACIIALNVSERHLAIKTTPPWKTKWTAVPTTVANHDGAVGS